MNSKTADQTEVGAELLTVDLEWLEPKRTEVELIALDNAKGDVFMAKCFMLNLVANPDYAREILGV